MADRDTCLRSITASKVASGSHWQKKTLEDYTVINSVPGFT
jgi:hypothetical protein